MRINPSAPNSYHVIQGDGGDAIIDSRARATGFGLLQIDGLVFEPSQPRQDFDLKDSTTQKLLEKFVNESFTKAVKEKDINAVNFFEPMLDDKDKFQNTPENRAAVISRYGDEINSWLQKQNQQPQPTQTQSRTAQPQKENPYLKSFALKQAVDKLKAKATQEHNMPLLLQLTRVQNNPAGLENILKRNGVEISQPQTKD